MRRRWGLSAWRSARASESLEWRGRRGGRGGRCGLWQWGRRRRRPQGGTAATGRRRQDDEMRKKKEGHGHGRAVECGRAGRSGGSRRGGGRARGAHGCKRASASASHWAAVARSTRGRPGVRAHARCAATDGARPRNRWRAASRACRWKLDAVGAARKSRVHWQPSGPLARAPCVHGATGRRGIQW